MASNIEVILYREWDNWSEDWLLKARMYLRGEIVFEDYPNQRALLLFTFQW